MTSEYTSQITVGLLLLSLISMLAVGLLATFLAYLYRRGRRSTCQAEDLPEPQVSAPGPYRASVFEQTCRWVVIRGGQVRAVQAALGLHNPTPCSWNEGLAHLTGHKLFISPPVRGWILVIGLGLPDPSDDVDRCFHFIVRLSRSLGHIQLFSVNRALGHYAWIRAEGGQVRRAYVWAGETLWNQGQPTSAERELGMKSYDYGEQPTASELGSSQAPGAQAERIMALAARWSLDPSSVDERMLRVGLGVSGELAHSR